MWFGHTIALWQCGLNGTTIVETAIKTKSYKSVMQVFIRKSEHLKSKCV